MHYRRHFLFDNWKGNDKLRWLPRINYFCYPFIDKRYLSHLTDNLICKAVENYDIIVPYPYDVKFCGSFNIREQISKLLPDYLLSFDLFINILCSELQEYKDEIKKIESGSIQFCCNMFICKTEIFQKYCKILFDILEELETELSRIYGDQINNSRILGYYGELLWSIFIFKEIKEGRSKIKFLNCSYIVDNFKKYTKTQFLFLNRFEFLIKLFGKKVRYNYELMKLVYK